MNRIAILLSTVAVSLLTGCAVPLDQAGYNQQFGLYADRYQSRSRSSDVPATGFAAPTKRFIAEAQELHSAVADFNPCGAGAAVTEKSADASASADLSGGSAGVKVKTNSRKRVDCSGKDKK